MLQNPERDQGEDSAAADGMTAHMVRVKYKGPEFNHLLSVGWIIIMVQGSWALLKR